jgi:phospholipase/carboxylesterase
MRLTTTEMGGLVTRVVDACDKPSLAVILCHGFGAGGDDLVPLGQMMLRSSGKLADAARFYFPAAPLDLSSMGMWGSRAWWMIDIDFVLQAHTDDKKRELIRHGKPEGMLEAREVVMTVLEQVKRETGLPTSRIVLGGFSQGSMITLDVALQLNETPAAVVAWSGTLLNEEEWRRRGALHKGMKVLQSHGRQDPLLPYDWAEHLRDMLVETGCDVEFLAFNGPHTIPEEGLSRAVALLERAL